MKGLSLELSSEGVEAEAREPLFEFGVVHRVDDDVVQPESVTDLDIKVSVEEELIPHTIA